MKLQNCSHQSFSRPELLEGKAGGDDSPSCLAKSHVYPGSTLYGDRHECHCELYNPPGGLKGGCAHSSPVRIQERFNRLKKSSSALKAYCAEVESSDLTEYSKTTYIDMADSFVRWLKGDFHPFTKSVLQSRTNRS